MSNPFSPSDQSQNNPELFDEHALAALEGMAIPQAGCGGCLSLLGGILLLATAMLGLASLVNGFSNPSTIGISAGLLGTYAVMTAMYLVPGIGILRAAYYARRARHDPEAIARSLESQRLVWWVAVLCMLLMGLFYVVALRNVSRR